MKRRNIKLWPAMLALSISGCSPSYDCIEISGGELEKIVQETSVNSSAVWEFEGKEENHLLLRHTRTGVSQCYKIPDTEIEISESVKLGGPGTILRKGDLFLIENGQRTIL